MKNYGSKNHSLDIANIQNIHELLAVAESSGHTLDFGISQDEDYVLTATLKDANDNVLSTHSVNLPLETAIVNASYADGVITFTLQNGETFTVDVAGIVSRSEEHTSEPSHL